MKLFVTHPNPNQKSSSTGIDLDQVVAWIFVPAGADGKPHLMIWFACWSAGDANRQTGHIHVEDAFALEINDALEKRALR